MDWPLLPPALRPVLLAAAAVPAAVTAAYVIAVPDGEYSEWMPSLIFLTPAIAALAEFVRLSRSQRLVNTVIRLGRLTTMIVEARDMARMSALLFEARQVSADAVRISGSMNDGRIHGRALDMHRRFGVMFDAASSEVRPTADNVREFQDTLRDLGRGISDRSWKAGRKDRR